MGGKRCEGHLPEETLGSLSGACGPRGPDSVEDSFPSAAAGKAYSGHFLE